ncbi:MAG: DUF222 domain-containing protein [Actinomycetota bacterium]
MSVEAVSCFQSAAADETAMVPVEVLSASGVVEEPRRRRRVAAQVEARCAELIGEADRRGIPEVEGFGSATGWLIAITGDPPTVCRSRVRVARALCHMPHTQEAFAAGDLSEPRVRLLVDAREFSPDLFCRDEALLVGQACRLSSRVFPLVLSQ